MKHYLIRLPPEAFVKIGFNLSGSCSLLDWSPFCCKYSIHVCLILVFFCLFGVGLISGSLVSERSSKNFVGIHSHLLTAMT